MLNRIITFISILTSVCTLVFFVLIYAMYQGFDPTPYLRGTLAYSRPATTTPLAAATTSPVLASSSTSLPKTVVASSTHVAAVVKPKAPSSVVKKQAKTNPTVSTPAPLFVEKSMSEKAASSTTVNPSDLGTPNNSGALNQKEIFEILNRERVAAGLPTLAFNVRLSAMAEGKAVDMINKQYFAHVSPLGVDAAQLAKTYHYEYIFLGENLAMGDFVSSADVMKGWMNSPGHRANILNKNYTEVGISALLGNYEGRTVWYAVQEFGRPLASCPSPDTALESTIADEEAQIKSSEQYLTALRAVIEESASDQARYNSLVEKYNTAIDGYNVLVTKTKSDIATFNAGVGAFNLCIGAGATSTPNSVSE